MFNSLSNSCYFAKSTINQMKKHCILREVHNFTMLHKTKASVLTLFLLNQNTFTILLNGHTNYIFLKTLLKEQNTYKLQLRDKFADCHIERTLSLVPLTFHSCVGRTEQQTERVEHVRKHLHASHAARMQHNTHTCEHVDQ